MKIRRSSKLGDHHCHDLDLFVLTAYVSADFKPEYNVAKAARPLR